MGENNQNKQKGQQAQQDVNQLLKVRREKLANLQQAGKDPGKSRLMITDLERHTDRELSRA